MNYATRTTCRACGEAAFEDVVSLGLQYLASFVPAKDESLPRSPLELVRCGKCGLLQLRHTVNPDLCFRQYFYRSSINQTMKDALADVVLHASKHAKEGAWVDIGANDGLLLSRVGERFTKIAVEPALNLHSLLEEHADHIIPDYFSAGPVLDKIDAADVITSCACFYDIDDPNEFVADIAKVLAPEGVWVNQLNDAPTMLKNNIWDGICSEHLTYWDIPALEKLYHRHGLHIVGLSHNTINGGSIRVTAMKGRGNGAKPTIGVASTNRSDVMAFADRTRRWKDLINDYLDAPSVRNAAIWGYGASTKGAVMLQYAGFADRLVAIADRNPAKWGTIAAGSWCAVTDEATMRKAKPHTLVVFPWAFRDEFVAREAELRRSGTRMLLPLPNLEVVL